AVDAIVAAAIRDQQRGVVLDMDEAGRIAARRAVETLRPARRERKEWRGLDQGAVMRADPIELLEQGGLRWRVVKPLELGRRGHQVVRHEVLRKEVTPP